MARNYRIAVIPGDGIGKETVPESLLVLDEAARRFGFGLAFDHYDWSCETYKQTGAMMPPDGMERLAAADSILLGAVGWPGVPDHISLWGLLIPIRRGFDQYVNLRPCKLMPGVRTPLADRTEADIDFFVVRENTEGGIQQRRRPIVRGHRSRAGQPGERVHPARCRPHPALRVRAGDDPGEEARHLGHQVQRHHLHHAVLDERFAEIGRAYPDIRTDQFHIDILCAHFVQHPDWFDVVVGSNLFGDILSDLGPAVAGSIGIAPSANINPERAHPSMFEPVHGSRPRHSRAAHLQSDRAGLVGGDDAGASRRGRGGRHDRRRDRDLVARQRPEDPRHGRPSGYLRCRARAGADRRGLTGAGFLIFSSGVTCDTRVEAIMPSLLRTRRYREELRRRGLRPVQVWVQDSRAPGFAERVRRDCEIMNAADQNDSVMAWVEAVSVFDEVDETR